MINRSIWRITTYIKLRQSDIIYVDFFNFLLLVKVEVCWSFLIGVAVWVRIRTFTVSLLIAFHEFNSTCSGVLVLVYLEVLRDLPLSLELSDLVRKVFQYDCTFLVLEFSQTAEDEVAHTNPHFLFHFSSDMADSLDLIKASNKEATVPQHFQDKSILIRLVFLLSD